MATAKPIQLYKGSVDEVFSHRTDIPPDAVLELRVYAPASPTEVPPLAEDDSALAKFGHLFGKGTSPQSDLAARAEEYLRATGFGETKSRRDFNP